MAALRWTEANASTPARLYRKQDAPIGAPYNITERTTLVNSRLLHLRGPPTFGISQDKEVMTCLVGRGAQVRSVPRALALMHHSEVLE